MPHPRTNERSVAKLAPLSVSHNGTRSMVSFTILLPRTRDAVHRHVLLALRALEHAKDLLFDAR